MLISCSPKLPVEPDVLEAIAVEYAVDHEREPLDGGLPARRAAGVEDDRPSGILRQLAFQRPNLLPSPLLVGLPRLLLDHLVDFGVAVAVPVQDRSAAVEDIEDRIGIGAAGLQVEA